MIKFDYHTTELRFVAHLEFNRLRNLEAFGGLEGRLATDPPQFEIEDCASDPGYHGEANWDTNHISIVIHPHTTVAELRETVLHELTHLCRRECYPHYGPFKQTLAQAAHEAWGTDFRDLAQGRCKTADLDHAIVTALVNQGWVAWFNRIQRAVSEVAEDMAAVPTEECTEECTEMGTEMGTITGRSRRTLQPHRIPRTP